MILRFFFLQRRGSGIGNSWFCQVEASPPHLIADREAICSNLTPIFLFNWNLLIPHRFHEAISCLCHLPLNVAHICPCFFPFFFVTVSFNHCLLAMLKREIPTPAFLPCRVCENPPTLQNPSNWERLGSQSKRRLHPQGWCGGEQRFNPIILIFLKHCTGNSLIWRSMLVPHNGWNKNLEKSGIWDPL